MATVPNTAKETRLKKSLEPLGQTYAKLKRQFDAAKKEYDKANDAKKKVEEELEDCREQIASIIIPSGVPRIHTTGCMIERQEGKEQVEVTDLEVLEQAEPDYVKIEKSAKKTDIMKDYKETGVVPPGTKIVYGDPFVKITV